MIDEFLGVTLDEDNYVPAPLNKEEDQSNFIGLNMAI